MGARAVFSESQRHRVGLKYMSRSVLTESREVRVGSGPHLVPPTVCS